MHISEGVLAPAVLYGGAVLACVGIGLGLRKLDYDKLMTVAILSAAFFVGSLIHVPIGPANAHLIINGLLGLLLGWAAFPSICVALILQAVLFQFGGLTVLGVNTLNMALPAVLAAFLCRPLIARGGKARMLGAFLCGALSVAGAGLCTALALALTDEGFMQAAQLLLLAHLPVMLVEGGITLLTVGFLAKVKPELLHNALGGKECA
jgi:cobalt/nickel transport system permease protein